MRRTPPRHGAGKAKIMDSVREVVALHKDRYVFPGRVVVTRASGTGMDSIFMGYIKPVDMSEDIIRCWTMSNGMILCVDQSFMDYAGWSTQVGGGAFLLRCCTVCCSPAVLLYCFLY